MRAHGAGKPLDFVGPLAFHRQADQKPGDLGLRGAPGHDFVHGSRGFRGREILAPGQLVDQRGKHT